MLLLEGHIIHLQHLIDLVTGGRDGNSQRGAQHAGRQALEFLCGQILALLSAEVEQTMPGARVEHVRTGLPEHQTKLLVVVSHEGRLRRLLGKDNIIQVLSVHVSNPINLIIIFILFVILSLDLIYNFRDCSVTQQLCQVDIITLVLWTADHYR